MFQQLFEVYGTSDILVNNAGLQKDSDFIVRIIFMSIKFITDKGIEFPSVTTEQMIEVDRQAMEETGPNLFQMMENAVRNLALQAIDCLGEDWQEANIVVLAGSGGNGGGGICAARIWQIAEQK